MTYETVATFSQVASLLFFIALFVGVVVYAFWPGNRGKFEAAQRQALGLDHPDREIDANRKSGGR
ncbi:MAG: cbb3-type cytochrome c oxidase subunit 3 [Hyphomicrobiaceae bacterium]|nr:cbb3-type cytochrome c oxidase subunit 3 [Hyphomicrobiaceae bacterium]